MDGCVEFVADKKSTGADRQPYVDLWPVQQTLADTSATIDSLSSGLQTVTEELMSPF